MIALNVFKVGGNVIDNEELLESFLQDFATVPGLKILVHGGGKGATKLASRLGVETKLIEGRRITSSEMLDVAVMSYAGTANKKIVAQLLGKSVMAIGLTGADGNVVQAARRPVTNGIDYGWVGDVTSVNAGLLKGLLELGLLPVLAPLTHDGRGNLLNTNADTIAGEVAVALSSEYKVTLNFCFELKGVMKDVHDPDSIIHNLDVVHYKELKDHQIISDGMIPKLDNAFRALERGVAGVRILKYDGLKNLNDGHSHTLLH